MRRICIYPKATGGGVGSFRLKFAAGLEKRGIQVSYDLKNPGEAVLVLAGTRNLPGLWGVKRRGIPIVQRLDGINWIHRRRRVSWRHTLRAEYGNFVLSYIRRSLADRIVYQSEFSRRWWEGWYGKIPASAHVIHNGVDLEAYSPGAVREKDSHYKLLVVEGGMEGGYDIGLVNAIKLAEVLATEHGLPMQLTVVGLISEPRRREWEAKSRVSIEWLGMVARDRIPDIDRSADLLFSADIHPACPNAVVEALACGLPVAAFDTGSLTELVPAEAGFVAPYGGDPWKLDPPDIERLAEGAARVLADLPRYRAGARAPAESALGLEEMVDAYLQILSGNIIR
jgi:glycosyltransferase involved in cell wall biosynthesis